MYTYNMFFKVRLADISQGVKELENELNNSMADFGFSEKMEVISESRLATIESEVMLTPEQMRDILETTNRVFKDQNSPFKCVSIDFNGCYGINAKS